MAELLSHPFFLILVSSAIFLLVIWAVLPFGLYGMRRRLSQNGEKLDRISDTLNRILEVLMAREEREELRETEFAGGGEIASGQGPADRLFVELRKEMLQFAPLMQERVLDTKFVVMLLRDGEGSEIPGMTLSLDESGVQVSIQLESIGQAFPDFSPGQFSQYAASFLPERHGYHTVASPDGHELQVNIEARDSNPLDLFIGIIREHLYEPLRGGADERAS